MKKLLFLFICLFSSQVFCKNANHDQIIDAIRFTKLETLKKILTNVQISKQEKESYLIFAQEILEKRDYNFKNFGKIGIDITDEHLIPVIQLTKWQKRFDKTGHLMSGVGAIGALISLYSTFHYFFKEAKTKRKLTKHEIDAIFEKAKSDIIYLDQSTSVLDFSKTFISLAFACGSTACLVAGDFLSKKNNPNTIEFKLIKLKELLSDALLIKELISNQN